MREVMKTAEGMYDDIMLEDIQEQQPTRFSLPLPLSVALSLSLSPRRSLCVRFFFYYP